MSARVRIGAAALSFRVRLTPKGGRDGIEGWMRGTDGAEFLKARVAAPPEDGKANAALISLLGKSLGIPKSTIRIASGQTARLKTIEISPPIDSVIARLEDLETVK